MIQTIETKCHLTDKALETANRMASAEGVSLEEICAWYGEKGIVTWGFENPCRVETLAHGPVDVMAVQG